jgi:hypothetical protein
MTAVNVLNDRVLPLYPEHGLTIEPVLTDNQREACGKPPSHPYELYLPIQPLEHRRTPSGSPETDGFRERAHPTVKKALFPVAYRPTLLQAT